MKNILFGTLNECYERIEDLKLRNDSLADSNSELENQNEMCSNQIENFIKKADFDYIEIQELTSKLSAVKGTLTEFKTLGDKRDIAISNYDDEVKELKSANINLKNHIFESKKKYEKMYEDYLSEHLKVSDLENEARILSKEDKLITEVIAKKVKDGIVKFNYNDEVVGIKDGYTAHLLATYFSHIANAVMFVVNTEKGDVIMSSCVFKDQN